MIIKNFVPDMYAKELKAAICSSSFPWYYNNSVGHKDVNEDFQFTHTFVRQGATNSDKLALVKPLLYFAEMHTGEKIKSILRIKANLRVPSNIPDSLKEIHKDEYAENYKTLLYYVNDSDGDTQVYAEDKKTLVESITPEANKAIWFPSNIWHKSSPPVASKTRIVINFVVEVE